MTEVVAFLLLALLATAAIGILSYRRYAQRELLRLREYEFFSTRFFAASDALINDADTPEMVLNMLSAMNEMIGDQRASRLFLERYESHHLEVRLQDRRAVIKSDMNEFMKRRSELAKQFADAVMSGVMAMTYLGNGWGVRARAILADAFVREPRPTDVIEVFEHSGCLPQAA